MGAWEQAIVPYYTAHSYVGGIPPKVGMTASDPYRQMVRNVAACSESLGPRLVGKMIVGMASGARRARASGSAVYDTSDHTKLKCLNDADSQHVRVQCFSHPTVHDFIGKSCRKHRPALRHFS